MATATSGTYIHSAFYSCSYLLTCLLAYNPSKEFLGDAVQKSKHKNPPKNTDLTRSGVVILEACNTTFSSIRSLATLGEFCRRVSPQSARSRPRCEFRGRDLRPEHGLRRLHARRGDSLGTLARPEAFRALVAVAVLPGGVKVAGAREVT